MQFPPAFFITATDTEIGKTVTSAILTVGLNATYWKPIQSGPPRDTAWIQSVSGLPESHFLPERYFLSRPLSPHLSARLDGISISLKDFVLPATTTSLIVEGAGGIMAPINEREFILDLIKHLNLPVVLVARSTLGTINHTMLSLDKLKQAQVNVLGIVMNGPKNSNNREAIEHFGQVPIIAEIEPIDKFNRETLLQVFHTQFQRQPCLVT